MRISDKQLRQIIHEEMNRMSEADEHSSDTPKHDHRYSSHAIRDRESRGMRAWADTPYAAVADAWAGLKVR